MNELLKKPYQISLWEDKVVYIIEQEGIIKEVEILPPDNYILLNEYNKEIKVAIIGSDTMDSPIRAISPKLTRNLNGTNSLSFQLYYRYFDEEEEEYKTNPFTSLMVNERKVKLNYDGEWFDLIIKQISEDSTNYCFTYTATDLYINELSKNGYDIELDTELENNIGTVTELGSLILEESDWQMAPTDKPIVLSDGTELLSEIIKQTREEALYQYVLKTSLRATCMSYFSYPGMETVQQGATINIPSGQTIFITYSSVSENSKEIQFFWRQGTRPSDTYLVDDKGIIQNSPNWIAEMPQDLKNDIENESLTISVNYRGNSLVKRQQTKYLSNIDKYCLVYKDEKDNIYYGYSQTEYANPTTVQNLITNNNNFINANGWNATEDCRAVYDRYVNENKTYPSLYVYFGSTGNVSNSGLYDHRAILNNFIKNDNYILAVKTFETYNPVNGGWATAYYHTSDKNRVDGKIYYTVDKKGNYQVSEDDDFISSKLYFEATELLSFRNGFSGSGELQGYKVFISTINDNFSYANIHDSYDIVFYLTGVNGGHIEDIKLFKEVRNSKKEIIVPDTTDLNSNGEDNNIIYTKYYFFPATIFDEVKVESIEDIIYSDVCYESELEGSIYKPVYSENYEKVGTITASKSNRFNLIQSICETFECWAKFVIDHDKTGRTLYEYRLTEDTEIQFGKKYYLANGLNDKNINKNYTIQDMELVNSPYKKYYERVYKKYVCFKKFIGQDNDIGFRYGINLKSIQRNIESNQIVTKLIVEPNSNEYAEDGYCSIQNSSLNSVGENFIYNFEYYIKQNLLFRADLYHDLYETNNGAIGYFTNLNKINRENKGLIKEITSLSLALTQLESEYQSHSLVVANAQKEREECINTIVAAIGDISYEDAEKLMLSKTQNSVVKDRIVRRDELSYRIEVSSEIVSTKKQLIDYYQKKYDLLEEKLQKNLLKKKNLDKSFYRKYSRFIQEGTWKSEDYYDANLYYLDAQGVSYTSASPQISYTINVLELSQLQGYKAYSFKIGDKTYIEDTDFFGWVPETGRPYQEEIVVSEVTYNLDDPSQNIIKVQNYKTQFEDLFQRISATTQSLQYASGTFARAAGAINSDGTINSSILKDSLYNNSLVLQNAKDQSVTWDETGITVTSLTSPNEIVRLVSGGILLTTDGGKNWTTGITGTGINASVITTGRLDTNKIRIFNENHQTFEWNSKGLNAFAINPDGSTQFNNFVRFDQFGLYSYVGGVDFNPQTVEEVASSPDVPFAITNKGFFIKCVDGKNEMHFSNEGYISIFTDKGWSFNLGLLEHSTNIADINKPYMREIINAGGNFIVWEDGSVYGNNGLFRGTMDVKALYINGSLAMDNDKIRGTHLNLQGVTVEDKDNNITFKVDATTGQVTINGKVIMGADSVIDWNIIDVKGTPPYKDQLDAAEETADDAYDKVNNIIKGLGIKNVSDIKNTYIDGTSISSPNIVGGTIVGSEIYATESSSSPYVKIGKGGIELYFKPNSGLPIIDVGFRPSGTNNAYKLPFIAFGQGTNQYGSDRGMVKKFTRGIWFGDSDSLAQSDASKPKSGTGIFIDFIDNKVYKYNSGTATEL